MHGRRATARKACALRHDHIADTAIRAASQGLRSQCHRAPYRLRLASHPDTRRRSANNTAHLETAKHRAQCTYQQACARAGSGTYLGAARRSHVIGIIGHTWRRNPYGNSAQAEPIGGRTADEIYQDFVRQVSELPKFNAKATCMIALEFIAPRVDSPMESETRITTTQYGLPRAVTNYTVPGATFSNGAPITLDLAWPEFRVAIEYDGDHHRTDKAQWRRDNDKRELLRHHHWIVLIATAANMADEPSQAELAYRAGRQLALRGSIFDFTLTATPLNELARRKRRKSTGAH